MNVSEYKQTPEYVEWRLRHDFGAEVWPGAEPDPPPRRTRRRPTKPPPVIPEDRQFEIALAALEARDRRKAAEAANERTAA